MLKLQIQKILHSGLLYPELYADGGPDTGIFMVMSYSWIHGRRQGTMIAERGTTNGNTKGGFSFLFIAHHSSFVV